MRLQSTPASGESVSDAVLIERLCRRDEEALDQLLRRYWNPLLGYASHLLGGRMDEAEDVVQRAFVRLWEQRDRLDPAVPIRPVLLRLTRSLAWNERRRLSRWVARAARWGAERSEEVHQSVPTPLDRLLETELQERLRVALEALPRRRREVFVLARFHDLTYAQIAAVMEISEQTVANQMSAALVTLRRAVDPGS